MSWRVLYIEESDYLSLYLDNIKVNKGKEDILIPISDIHSLILDNYKITLSVHLINALAKNNVNVVVCDVDHLPTSIIIPHTGNYYAPIIFRKQLKWEKEKKEKLHQIIVKSKIQNQKRLIQYVNPNSHYIEMLENYEDEVYPGDKTNREGLAAKIYFSALFGSEF